MKFPDSTPPLSERMVCLYQELDRSVAAGVDMTAHAVVQLPSLIEEVRHLERVVASYETGTVPVYRIDALPKFPQQRWVTDGGDDDQQ
jgi:hypothetical protein